MSAISSSPISGRGPPSSDLPLLLELAASCCVRRRSLSRRFAAFSNSCASMAASFSLRTRLDLVLELAVRGRGGHGADAHAAAGLVDEVDGLVRQEAVGDVAVGQVGRGLERLVGDRAAVVRLVAVAQPAQDLDGLLLGGFLHQDLLEAALEGRVALEVLAVLVEGRRADGLQLAARQRRLEDAGRVDGALGRTRADEVVQLVDEQDDVAALGDLLHHLLEALLELAAVLRPGHEGREVQRVDLLVLEQVRHLVARDALGEALDDGGLADAGLADEHRVVLRAAREDLHHALDLVLAADDRVELAIGGQLGQVAPELLQQLARLLVGGRPTGGLALLAATRAREHADDLVADLLGVGVEVRQDACGDALVLAHEAEQDVLGADVVVPERQRLAKCQLEDLLGAGGERDLARGHLFPGPDDPDDLRPDLLHRDFKPLEDPCRETFLFAQQAEEDVLGPDVVVLEGTRLFLGQDDDLARPLGEPLEQRDLLFAKQSLRISAATAPTGQYPPGQTAAWSHSHPTFRTGTPSCIQLCKALNSSREPRPSAGVPILNAHAGSRRSYRPPVRRTADRWIRAVEPLRSRSRPCGGSGRTTRRYGAI